MSQYTQQCYNTLHNPFLATLLSADPWQCIANGTSFAFFVLFSLNILNAWVGYLVAAFTIYSTYSRLDSHRWLAQCVSSGFYKSWWNYKCTPAIQLVFFCIASVSTGQWLSLDIYLSPTNSASAVCNIYVYSINKLFGISLMVWLSASPHHCLPASATPIYLNSISYHSLSIHH